MNYCIDIDHDHSYDPEILSDQPSSSKDTLLSQNADDKQKEENVDQKQVTNRYKNRWTLAEQKKYINFLV